MSNPLHFTPVWLCLMPCCFCWTLSQFRVMIVTAQDAIHCNLSCCCSVENQNWHPCLCSSLVLGDVGCACIGTPGQASVSLQQAALACLRLSTLLREHAQAPIGKPSILEQCCVCTEARPPKCVCITCTAGMHLAPASPEWMTN